MQAAPTHVKADSNAPVKSDSSQQHSADTERSVGITRLPPVTLNPSKRDAADWGYWAFSGLLVVVGSLQVWLLFKTLSAIQRQGDQMEHQTNALRRQGVSMRRQTTILRKSATLMEGQLGEMQKALELENRTLVLQYRPKITVRNAKALQFSYDLGNPWECEIRFQIVNTGGSPAYIAAGSHIQLASSISHDVGKIETKWGEERPISSVMLGPGQAITVEERVSTGVPFDLEWENFRQGVAVKPLRFVSLAGIVYYTDDLGIPRSTGINRAFEPKTGEFVPRKETEQEYND